MSALYTAVKLEGADWRSFHHALPLGDVFDTLAGAIPHGDCRGFLRLDTGKEVGFRATVDGVPGPDGLHNMEIHVDDALEAEVARLRAALEAIAALQAESPEWRPVLHRDSADGYYGKWHEAAEQLHGAAEMARVALRGGK